MPRWWMAEGPARTVAGVQTEAASLRRVAHDAIAPLQAAVDLNQAAVAEVVLLKNWKRYGVALNRIPEQTGYPASIDWPASSVCSTRPSDRHLAVFSASRNP